MRVLGSSKCLIRDYITWTYPEFKYAGCHIGIHVEKITAKNKMASIPNRIDA